MDILSGSWPGELYVFRGLGGNKFAAGQAIKDKDDQPIKPGSASTVFAADWDGDGDLDLVLGNIEGQVQLVRNEGTKTKSAFGKREPLSAGTQAITVPHGDSGPIVVDWNRDGKRDLIVGAGDGSVWLFAGSGTATEPVLAAGRILVPAGTSGFGSEPTSDGRPWGVRTKVAVADWNRDGLADLLVGDFAVVQEKLPEPEPGAKEKFAKADRDYQEAQKAYVAASEKAGLNALQAEYSRLSAQPADETPQAAKKRGAALKEVEARMATIQAEIKPAFDALMAAQRQIRQPQHTYHGWVWLFQRKPSATAPLAN